MGELLITLFYFILFNYLSACGRQVHMQTIIRIVYKLKFDTQSTILWSSQGEWEWPNPVILKDGDGILPLRAAQRRVKEIKIPCES